MTDLQKRISEKLRKLGANCGLLGFIYAKTAVELAYNDETYLRDITKRLYPDIAKLHDTKPNKAERAIRHFIESIYNGSSPDINEAVGVPPNIHTGRLKNSEFIAALVESLKCEE